MLKKLYTCSYEEDFDIKAYSGTLSRLKSP